MSTFKNLDRFLTNNNSAISEGIFINGDDFNYNQKQNILILKGDVKPGLK